MSERVGVGSEEPTDVPAGTFQVPADPKWVNARVETERLILRVPRPEDAEPHHRLIGADPEVMRWIPPQVPQDWEWSQVRMARWAEKWGSGVIAPWIVELRATGEVIGHCGLSWLEDSGELEVLYGLGRPFWGVGYATEGARASVAWAFANAELEKVIGLTIPGNTKSQRVLEKCGMRSVGPATHFGLDLDSFAVLRADAASEGRDPRNG